MFFFNTISTIIKYFIPTLLFISTVLLGFLLAGCSIDTKSISSVYLVSIGFNESSSIFPQVASGKYRLNNSTAFSPIGMKVRVGYLGMCLDLNGTVTCSTNKQIGQLLNGTSIQIPNMPTSMNLVSLGNSFSSMCHPFMLAATLAISLVLFAMLLWSAVPFLPFKSSIKTISCVLAFGNIITWGLGSMLQQEAITAAKKIISPASMNVLVAEKGSRSIAMTWTAFSFNLLVFFGTLATFITDIRMKSKNQPSSVGVKY